MRLVEKATQNEESQAKFAAGPVYLEDFSTLKETGEARKES